MSTGIKNKNRSPGFFDRIIGFSSPIVLFTLSPIDVVKINESPLIPYGVISPQTTIIIAVKISGRILQQDIDLPFIFIGNAFAR